MIQQGEALQTLDNKVYIKGQPKDLMSVAEQLVDVARLPLSPDDVQTETKTMRWVPKRDGSRQLQAANPGRGAFVVTIVSVK